jgi:hypothetical protein
MKRNLVFKYWVLACEFNDNKKQTNKQKIQKTETTTTTTPRQKTHKKPKCLIMVCVVSNSENACTHFDFFPKNDECFSPD